jgi:serine/threonine protein kinase
MGAVVNKGVSDSWEGYEVFKRYRFTEIKLGVGQTSQIREAIENSTKTTYAVKIVVKDEAELAGKSQSDLKKEAAIISKLKHPNICSCHECFEDKDLFFYILEMCGGGTLFDKLEQDVVLEEQQAKKMAKEMFGAVNHMHEKGVIHRDLRPESWLLTDVTDDAQLKLGNFSLAEECPKDGCLAQPCGTLHYVAPEVLRGSYGRSSDIWTVGVLLFLIVYGSYPFDGDDASRVMHAIMAVEPDWSNSCYRLSHEVTDLLKSLLVKAPEQRVTLQQCLKHPWLPGGSDSRRTSLFSLNSWKNRKNSQRNSQITAIRKVRDSARNSDTGSLSRNRTLSLSAGISPSIPELKAEPGGSRRPSIMITQDLISKLEREARQREQIEATEAKDKLEKVFSPQSTPSAETVEPKGTIS